MKRILSSLLMCGLLLTPCIAAESLAAATQASAPASTKPVPKGSGYRGNPDTKVYHAAGCRYFTSKGASKQFGTEQEATRAGYRPCKVCKGK